MPHPEWPLALRLFLFIHILSGTIALVCAPVALAVTKGGRAHRRWGAVYFWSMASVAVTAMMLSLLLPIIFLALVAVFSFYSAFTAYRVLSMKDLYKGGRPAPLDWAAAILTFASSLALATLGVTHPKLMGVGVISLAGHPVSIVSVVFGFIGMRTAQRTMATFRTPPADKLFWWYGHMQGMMASYIAALTAFSSVNLSHWFGQAWWVWLWPTLLGAPVIAVWTAYYQRKFAARAKTSAAVA